MYSNVKVSVIPDVSLCVSLDNSLSTTGVYQIIEVANGCYELVQSNVSVDSQDAAVSTDVDPGTEVSQSTESSSSANTSTRSDNSFQESVNNTSARSDQSFQESLDALFTSIQPDDDEQENNDLAPEIVTDVRYGEPLDNSLTNSHDEQPSNSSSASSPFNGIPPDSPLASHPFFSDLCNILQADCQQTALPSNLLQTLDNKPGQVTLEEQQLKIRFQQLEADFPGKVKELSTLFQFHTASIEMERMACVVNQSTVEYKMWLNSYFDTQIKQVMERVNRSLQVLEESRKPSFSSSWLSGVRHRPTLSKKAIDIMEQWYQSNLHHPYPSTTVVEAMTIAGGVSTDQVKKWFGNKRNRGGNTRSLTEIAKRKHRLRQGGQRKPHQELIGNLALYL